MPERDDPKSFEGVRDGKTGHILRNGNQNRTCQHLHQMLKDNEITPLKI